MKDVIPKILTKTAKIVHHCDACGEDICEGDTAYKVSLLNGGELWFCTGCCGLYEVEVDDDDY